MSLDVVLADKQLNSDGGCNVQEGIKLILHVLAKTMDNSLTCDKVELSTITKDASTNAVRISLGLIEADVACTHFRR